MSSPRRTSDLVFDHAAVRFLVELFEQEPQHVVTRVRVVPAFLGGESEWCRVDKCEQAAGRSRRQKAWLWLFLGEGRVVEPRRVIEELADRHAPPPVAPGRQITGRRLVEIDLSAFDPLQNCRRGELLADRSNVHHGRGIERLTRGKVGQAEAPGERDPTVSSDGDGQSRDRRFTQDMLDDTRHMPAALAADWPRLARGRCKRKTRDPDVDRDESWL